jgi:hypothetical protein
MLLGCRPIFSNLLHLACRVTCLRETAGNENGRRLSLLMASVVARWREDGSKQPNPTRYQPAYFATTLQFQIAPLMNKTG